MLTSFALRLLLRGQLPLHLRNLGTFNTRLTKLESQFCWLVQNLRLQITVRNPMQNLHPHLFRLALKAQKYQGGKVKSLQECFIHLQKPVRSMGKDLPPESTFFIRSTVNQHESVNTCLLSSIRQELGIWWGWRQGRDGERGREKTRQDKRG